MIAMLSFLQTLWPNHTFDRSAKRRCRSVPVAHRAPAPGNCERSAS